MSMNAVKASAMTNSDMQQIAALLGGQVDPHELEIRLRARLCQDSLKEFVKTFWHVIEPGRELIWGWPIEAICDHLEAVTRGEIRRLLITVPPGSSKSLLTRVFWPAWEWSREPSRRYIGASYAQHLAERDNRRARSIIQSDLYKKMFDHVKMSDEQATKTNFANTATGWMFATSVRGLGTGERGDRFICLPAQEVVWTEHGPMSIKSVVDEADKNLRVWSFDEASGRMVLRRVVGFYKNPGSQIVRVTKSDGGSVLVTPDHKIITKGGRVRADSLSRFDLLPDPVIVGSSDAFGLFSPCLADSNCGDMAGGYSEFFCNLIGGLVRYFANLNGIGFGNLHFPSCSKGAVPFGILNVFRPRSVSDVLKSIVERVAIEVSDIVSFGARPNKGQGNGYVGIHGLHCLLGRDWAHVAPNVSSSVVHQAEFFCRDSQRAPVFSDYGSSQTPDATCVGDFVSPFISGYSTPDSVSFVGHVDDTYCISVEGTRNFMAGDGIIVSNCDDPHNVSEAESANKRQEALLWFSETVPSRLNDLDKDAIVIIMQRVHQDDVAQAAIDRRYEHLLIPMHYDSSRAKVTSIGWSDPRTEDGQLMWPERFSARAVADLEDALGPYAAAAQLEQEPVPRQGGLFTPENIVEVEELPDTEADYEFVRAWDLAASEGAGAYTVGVKMGRNLKNGNFYIVDVKRKRLGPDGVRKMITSAAAEDGAGVPIRIPQDPGQAGKAQVASIISELAGYNARAEAQSGSKETRAEPLAAQVEAGNVRILTRGWTKAFLEEMRFFPRGKYKDQVDAASSAFNALATKRKRGIGGLFALGDKQRNAARPF